MSVKRTPPKHSSNPDLPSASGSAEDEYKSIVTRKRKQPDCDFTSAFSTLQLELQKTLKEFRQDFDNKLEKINENISVIKNDLETYTLEIKKEINALRNENIIIKKNMTETSQDVSDLKSSLQFHSDQQEDLKKRVDQLTARTQNSSLSADSVKSLELKINVLEQQARQCNLELSNVPEKRGENLLNIVETIGNVIGCNISQNDIVSAHRVPHVHQQAKNPKNIIVKLTTRTLRDNVLSATRLNKGVTTNQLGISGAEQKIYINEHLTLKNKQLFRRSRELAKKHNYRYVWVKHSTILARETDNSPVLAIRNENDLDKIKTANPRDNSGAN